MELETVWSGSDRDVYLCVPDPQQPMLRVKPLILPPTRPYGDHRALKAQVLALLAERPRWRVKELRELLRVESLILAGVISRACASGEMAREGHGTIRLIHRRTSKRRRGRGTQESAA